MPDSIAIKLENVSKKYSIGKEKDGSLRGTLGGMFSKKSASTEDFWALKDVSFDIQKGDVVGIIGKNGAGKSTLLKILSQITKPTEGRIEINGRVASLLEVGTGFHPELTGRENVFLNGTILGMTRKEVAAKFDEIVAFSGVEKFIDTPVKRYSSGMYVRLAFAVAAHLEPEILIIDEVLAVGDAEFQKKCLGKMKDVAGEGRTVIFVSHNMAAVKALCNKGIVMEKGVVKFQGTQIEASAYYFSNTITKAFYMHDGTVENTIGNENIRITRFEVKPRKGNVLSIYSGIDFEIDFNNYLENKNIDITFEVLDNEGGVVFHNGVIITKNKDSISGNYVITAGLPNQLLNAGKYSINLIFGENQHFLLLKVEDLVQFEVMHESSGSNNSKVPGVIFPELNFHIKAPIKN